MQEQHVFIPKMGYGNEYTVYEIEKDKKYLFINNHKAVEIQPNGLPKHSELIMVDNHEQIREVFKSREIFMLPDVMYPATLEQVKALYDPENEAKSKNMTFLCESCVNMDDCPRFNEYEKYLVLYNTDRILEGHSYYRGLAYHATILQCPSYIEGKINKNRGFMLVVKRCEDCPWIKREEHYNYNDSVHCDLKGTEIHSSNHAIDSEVNFIPDWCPKLPENKKKEK